MTQEDASLTKGPADRPVPTPAPASAPAATKKPFTREDAIAVLSMLVVLGMMVLGAVKMIWGLE